MKHLIARVPAVLMACLFAVSFVTAANAASKPPPEMEAWLKAAKLGPYDKAENWTRSSPRRKPKARSWSTRRPVASPSW